MATSKKLTVWQRGGEYARKASDDALYRLSEAMSMTKDSYEYELTNAWYRGYMVGAAAANARAKKRK